MRTLLILAILLAAVLLPAIIAIIEIVATILLATARFTAPRVRRVRSAFHRTLLTLRAPPAIA